MTQTRFGGPPVWLIFVAVALGASAVVIFVAGKQHSGFSASAKRAADETTVRIPVQGMTCSICAARVKKALQSVEGVQEAGIDLERREARVRYDARRVSPGRLVAAVNQLGYRAGTPVAVSEGPR